MPFLLPTKQIRRANNHAYIQLLERVFECGLVSIATIYLSSESHRNAQRHLNFAIEAGHIRVLAFRQRVGTNIQERKYYAITQNGLLFLNEYGEADWHYHIPISQTELSKEVYDVDKARQRAAVGDAYAFAKWVGAELSDFIFCGQPGNPSDVLTGARPAVMGNEQWGQSIEDQIDFELDDGLIDDQVESRHLFMPNEKTISEIKKRMYATWAMADGRTNTLTEADLYYFSAAELRRMAIEAKPLANAKEQEKELQDIIGGKYVGILNGKDKSFLVYRASKEGFGWSKKAGSRDGKAASKTSIRLLPYNNITRKMEESIVLCGGPVDFFNTVTDRFGKRAGVRSKPAFIGEGFSKMRAVQMTPDGYRAFQYWVLNKSDTERRAIIEEEIEKEYPELTKYTNDKPSKSFAVPPLYMYEGKVPVYNLADLDLKMLEALSKWVKSKAADNITIGIIGFSCHGNYFQSLFRDAGQRMLFELELPPLEQTPNA